MAARSRASNPSLPVTDKQSARRYFFSLLIGDSVIETKDLYIAAFLVAMGAKVTQMKGGMSAKTGGARNVFRIEHPQLKFLVHRYFEPMSVCAWKLGVERDRLKRGMPFLPPL